MANNKATDSQESAEQSSAENATAEQLDSVDSRPQIEAFDPFAIPEVALDQLLSTNNLGDEDDHQQQEKVQDSNRQRKTNRSHKKPSNGGDQDKANGPDSQDSGSTSTSRRRRRRRRGEEDMEIEGGDRSDPPGSVTRVRGPRQNGSEINTNQVTSLRGSTRLEAKRQRRRDSRDVGRRRHGISEAEFLARRESMDRKMMVREQDDRIQIAVLEDDVLAEHFVSHTTQDSLIGNVYLGRVQNVLPSMEAAFVDIGRGRNAVLYAGEVNWDAAQLDGKAKRIENALKSGDSVLVQVTKDPVGHKGARLTSQISLPGRYLVYVPGGSMTGISRKLPEVERTRLKKILREHTPDQAGVIVRTAAEGASEQELMNDINRLRVQWEAIEKASKSTKTRAPEMLYAEPDLTIKTVRDVFNEDFSELVVQGEQVWDTIEAYVTYVAPDLLDRLSQWQDKTDLFDAKRISEGIAKALDRKVNLPSGGSLVIDRTEAMTVIDVNTGKFTGNGGNLEETVTKNNLEAAEEVVRQLRLRDIGGIIVIDFIDMVLEANRDLVLRRLMECLGRDRTKHQVSEVTSLGLVQMTRKRVGTGLVEIFSTTCESCAGRGLIIHDEPLVGSHRPQHVHQPSDRPTRSERRRNRQNDRDKHQSNGNGQKSDHDRKDGKPQQGQKQDQPEHSKEDQERAAATREALSKIAAATHHEPEEASTGKDAPKHNTDGDTSTGRGNDKDVAIAADSQAGREDTSRQHSHSNDDHEGGGRRRRRGRRGRGGRGRQDHNESQHQPEPAQVASAEQPGTSPAEAHTVSPERPGRRRRAAGSAQGSTNAAVVKTQSQAGARVSSADSTSTPTPQKEPEVTMLGVGVSAQEISRG